MESLIVLGFDGFAKSVIDSAMGTKEYDSIIILDNEGNLGKEFANSKVVGTIEELPRYYDKGYRLVYIANENDLKWRKEISTRAKEIGFSFATIIDISAEIAEDVSIGDGVYVGKGCVIGPCSSVGENTILDTGVILQSGCRIGDLSRICTGGVVSYDAKIGDMCYIGVRTIVTEETEVPNSTITEDVSVYGKQFFEKQ